MRVNLDNLRDKGLIEVINLTHVCPECGEMLDCYEGTGGNTPSIVEICIYCGWNYHF